MSEKQKYTGSDFSLKPGFDIQKRLEAAEDQTAFIKGLSEQEKNFLKTYRSNRKFFVEDFDKEVAGKSKEEIQSYISSLHPDAKEFLKHERQRQRAAVPTPEKVDKIVADEKATKELLINERSPDVSFIDRLAIKNLVPRNQWAQALRRKMPEHDIIEHNNNVWVKRKDEDKYRALDPDTLEMEDVTDLPVDFLQGAAEGIGAGLGATGAALAAVSNPVTAPLAPAAALTGGVLGGGATAGIASTGKQGLAKYLGYQDEIDPNEVQTEAAFGGALSLLPGSKTYVKGTKEALATVGKKTAYDQNLNKIRVPIEMEGADKILHPFRKKGEQTLDFLREKSTGMNPRALQLGREYPDYIAKVQKAQKEGYDPVIVAARDIRKQAAEQIKDLEKYTYAKKEKLMSDTNAKVNVSQLRKELQQEFKIKRDSLVDIYGKNAIPDSAKEELRKLRSVYENLPRKTNEIDVRTADDIKSRLNNLVGIEKTDTKDIKRAKIAASKYTKRFEEQIEEQIPHYKDANAQYAQVKEFEKYFKDKGLVEENLDKVKRRPKEIEGLAPPSAYTKAEEKAVKSLTTSEPSLTTNLKGLDSFTRNLAAEKLGSTLGPEKKKILARQLKDQSRKPGELEKIHEKKVALKQWLPKEKNPVLPGESRKSTLTNTMATAGIGIGAGVLGSPWALLPTAAYMAAMTPTGVLKQYQLGKALKESKPLQYGLGVQPMRTVTGNVYENLRSKEDDLYGTKN